MATRAQLIRRARKMRKQPTRSEALLWLRLKNKQLDGRKFRRQHVLHPYIVDFYCFSERLVIEIDGCTHDDPEIARQDRIRAEYLREHHRVSTILRFGHARVLADEDKVLRRIRESFQ